MVHSSRIVLSAGQAGNLKSRMSLCGRERSVILCVVKKEQNTWTGEAELD